MKQYFYMRVVSRYHKGGLITHGEERGSVTTSPVEAFKRDRRAFERRFLEKYDSWEADHRGGRMFAYWSLGTKMPWHQAVDVARTTPPDRVCVLTCSHQWWMVEFVLPPGELIRVDQWPQTLPGWKKQQRST